MGLRLVCQQRRGEQLVDHGGHQPGQQRRADQPSNDHLRERRVERTALQRQRQEGNDSVSGGKAPLVDQTKEFLGGPIVVEAGRDGRGDGDRTCTSGVDASKRVRATCRSGTGWPRSEVTLSRSSSSGRGAPSIETESPVPLRRRTRMGRSPPSSAPTRRPGSEDCRDRRRRSASRSARRAGGRSRTS